MTRRRVATAAVLAFLVIAIYPFARDWQIRQQWFQIQSQQLSAIDKLRDYPPNAANPNAWDNVITTTYNVWGNVTYHPSYSNISNAEMRSLKQKLDEVVANTSRKNSPASVDQVYGLLLSLDFKTEFVAGYHDEFKQYLEGLEHRIEVN
ncbi:hypothetical protein [Thalassoglobus polymorphus]|uniref:Uncharacterized protein n=1 Tax=Thalassoglobus polymorphus TaxID=2527994 RepID=A0A517QUS6_9PLAN|nr:hypothetical protein [Thalassoglobus polymorphus]QDT35385.1 hypothetical protein Mal48_46620 [Thalassoglobus polymorphus]